MQTVGPRIVSLLPSATEIVCALGLRQLLVGRSHECDFPNGIESLPVCCDSRVSREKESGAIDNEVKNLINNGLSLFEVFPNELRRLAPDVVITQTQCEVCAVSRADVEHALGEWIGTQPTVISLAPQNLAQVWTSIEIVADALDVPNRAEEVRNTIDGRIDAVVTRAKTTMPRSIACLEWLNPLMAAGNWVPELVTLAHGTDLLATAGEHSPWLEWNQLLNADPEIILSMPCGFSLEHTRRESRTLTQHEFGSRLRAIRDQRVFLADGHQFFNRPGPRLVESLEILAEIIHPELFKPKHKGTAWEQMR